MFYRNKYSLHHFFLNFNTDCMVFFFSLFFWGGGGSVTPHPEISNGPSLKQHIIYICDLKCIASAKAVGFNYIYIYNVQKSYHTIGWSYMHVQCDFNIFFCWSCKNKHLSLNTKMKCHGNEIWLAYYFLIIFFQVV